MATHPPGALSRADLAALALLAVSVHAPALAGEFVLDDVQAVVRSSCVTGAFDPVAIATRDFWCETVPTITAYRPLAVAWSWLVWHAGGGSATFFHAVGLVLHAACAIGVAGLGQRLGLGRWQALCGGGLFAVLAIHADAVASVVGQAELSATALVLLAARSLTAGSRLAPLVAAAAVGFKESALLGAPLYVLLAGARVGRASGRRALAAIVAVGLVWSLRFVALGEAAALGPSAIDNPLVEAPAWTRIPAMLEVTARYVTLSLVGWPLSADYGYRAVGVGEDAHWGYVALGAALIAGGAALARRRTDPAHRVLIPFLFASAVVLGHVIVPLPAILAERLWYLPSVGLCLLAAASVPDPALLRPRAGLPLLLFAALQATLAARHAHAWTREDSITAVTVEHSPRSARAQLWRARVLLRRGDAEGALRHADAAAEIRPDAALPHALAAASLDLLGRPDWALQRYRRAFELDPRDAESTDLFVQFLLRFGHRPQAEHVLAIHRAALAAP